MVSPTNGWNQILKKVNWENPLAKKWIGKNHLENKGNFRKKKEKSQKGNFRKKREKPKSEFSEKKEKSQKVIFQKKKGQKVNFHKWKWLRQNPRTTVNKLRKQSFRPFMTLDFVIIFILPTTFQTWSTRASYWGVGNTFRKLGNKWTRNPMTTLEETRPNHDSNRIAI